MRVQATIQKWGNSLAIRLTGLLRSIPHFEENMVVNIDIDESGIAVHPTKSKFKKLIFKEKDLLKGLTFQKAHADELFQLTLKDMRE